MKITIKWSFASSVPAGGENRWNFKKPISFLSKHILLIIPLKGFESLNSQVSSLNSKKKIISNGKENEFLLKRMYFSFDSYLLPVKP